MALLTAEDVLNKAFSKTKYREGFDQDEVDDFLDEVANTIAALTAERDELQQRLAQAQAGGAVVPPAATPGADTAQVPSQSFLQAATDPNPPSATTMLAMAQKLHDEYVQAGEEARDRLIDEGKIKAETIVEQAETDARGRMQDLETERADLERRIDDLRRFERDYRGHLRNYLENLLGDLEHNASKASAGPVGSADVETPSAPPTLPDTVSDSMFDSVPGSMPGPEPVPDPELASAPEPAPAFGEQWGNPEPEQAPHVGEAERIPHAGEEGFVPIAGDHDESGEDPADAPRWNF
ncbi:DivIVA domain-containing protein [Demequina sp.]|uniref:DivIVA domain-containing protein n=1 Tax=Demequina sp. TaxID=2050685 RepID=UPI0025BF30A9|nr:DivIVA domain-containing protein [Demequina sp.]